MDRGVIVVADDLGANERKNAGILRALDTGLVDAASVMVNGPAFEQASELAAPFADRIGIHLVLTEGEPLTDAVRRLGRFCDTEGRYRGWRPADRVFRIASDERHAVAAEWRAQIDRARAAGFARSHLDSHHHVHTEPGLAPIALALALDLGIGRVRLARNWGAGMGPLNRAWKSVFNRRVRRAGLAGTRWFGSLVDYEHRKARRPHPSDFEVMVHPRVGPDGEIEDEDTPGIPLARLLVSVRERKDEAQ